MNCITKNSFITHPGKPEEKPEERAAVNIFYKYEVLHKQVKGLNLSRVCTAVKNHLRTKGRIYLQK